MKQKVIKYTILLLLIPVIISIVLSFMQVDEEKKYPNDNWARLEFARLLKKMKQYQNALQQLYIIQHRLTEKDRKLKIDQYTTLEIYNLNFLMDRYEKSF